MKIKVYALTAVVLCAHATASGQAVTRVIAVDGGAAHGFPGSSLDIAYNDQSAVNSLPQLLADGEVTFRARIAPSIGGAASPDSWWISREGSYQVAAFNGGNSGIEFIPVSQFARMFAGPSDSRVVIDRGQGRIFAWQEQRWVPIISNDPARPTVDGAPWMFSQLDRTSVLMPRADLLVFAATVPIPPGAPIAGPGPGFVAGWNGVYDTLVSTGEGVPGLPGTFFIAPDPTGNTGPDSAIGRTLRINATGRWVARVGLLGAGVTGSSSSAIYRGTVGGAPVAVVRAGDTAPGWAPSQGARIASLSRPSINSQGHIAFVARTLTTSPSSSSFFSLYADRGAGLELLAKTGDPVIPAVPTFPAPTINAPWTPTALIPAAPVIGDDGTVAFAAFLSHGEAVLAHRQGAVHEMVRRDMALPRTGGRVVARSFDQAQPEGATGLAIAPNGDVVFSMPTTGNYDPRLATITTPRHSVLSWRPGRGVRIVSCQGQPFDDLPGMHNRIVASNLLGDGNTADGAPTGLGQAGFAALQVDFARFTNDTSGAFQAVVVADLNVFACGVADIARAGAEPLGDGVLDNNDFVVMIDRFFSGDLRADYGRQGGAIGFDDRLDNNDFVAFIDLFFTGCP